MDYILFTLWFLLGICADILYFKQVLCKDIRPNRWFWLISSVAATLEATTYMGITSDWINILSFCYTPLYCALISVLIWKKALWNKPNWVDIASVAISLISLTVWAIFRTALWAHVIMLAVIPISYIPLWKGIWADSESEDPATWKLWALSAFFRLVMVLLRLDSDQESFYGAVEFICYGATWFLIRLRQSNTGSA